jgi:F-type H+-transporting ATPase subunit b
MKSASARFYPLTLLLIAGIIASPEIALAAEESGKWGIWLDIGKIFNLILVIGVLIFVLRKPLANFFAGRTQEIREQLAEAQKARQEAEAKLAEVESRIHHLDDEIRDIKAAAEREADEEYQRLLHIAEQDAEKIVERSKQEIEGITRAAQQELKQQVAELSVKLAEEKIRGEITEDDRGRIFSRFIAKLGDKS